MSVSDSDAMPPKSDAMPPERANFGGWARVFGNVVVNATKQGERVYLRLRSWTKEEGYKFHGYLGALNSRRDSYGGEQTKQVSDEHKNEYESKRGKRGGRRAGSTNVG